MQMLDFRGTTLLAADSLLSSNAVWLAAAVIALIWLGPETRGRALA